MDISSSAINVQRETDRLWRRVCGQISPSQVYQDIDLAIMTTDQAQQKIAGLWQDFKSFFGLKYSRAFFKSYCQLIESMQENNNEVYLTDEIADIIAELFQIKSQRESTDATLIYFLPLGIDYGNFQVIYDSLLQQQRILIKSSTQMIVNNSTGHSIWPSSKLFTSYVTLNLKQFFNAKQVNILELGSGVGLFGCCLKAQSGYFKGDINLICSDIDTQVMQKCEWNLSHIQSDNMKCSTEILDFDDIKDFKWDSKFNYVLNAQNVIISCDCVYTHDLIDMIVPALRFLITDVPNSTAFIACPIRREDTYQYLLDQLQKFNLKFEMVNINEPCFSLAEEVFGCQRQDIQQTRIIKIVQ